MIFKIDLVNVLLGFLQNFCTIPIMNPLSWFMISNSSCITCSFRPQNFPAIIAIWYLTMYVIVEINLPYRGLFSKQKFSQEMQNLNFKEF